MEFKIFYQRVEADIASLRRQRYLIPTTLGLQLFETEEVLENVTERRSLFLEIRLPSDFPLSPHPIGRISHLPIPTRYILRTKIFNPRNPSV